MVFWRKGVGVACAVAAAGLVAPAGGAQDWRGIPVPADAGNGRTWQIDNALSRDFNQSTKSAALGNAWQDRYINGWRGPGLTQFSSNHTSVGGGHLILSAARVPNTNRVYCGVATTKGTVRYPVFVEASIKVSGLVLSSNLWLLSRDDVQELDIVELYGSNRQSWFAQRSSSNYHIFERDANNRILKDNNDQKHHLLPNGVPYRNAFHRFGAYWKSPFEVDFYIDGRKVRELRRNGITDPRGRGLDQPMPIILDTEDHAWRSNQGIVASDAELRNDSINKMRVDWIRVYKPVAASNPAPRPAPAPTGRQRINLDFGTANSPVRRGWTRVSPAGGAGVSWSPGVYSRDRGTDERINEINRDFVFQSAASNLSMPIANGRWGVTINMGDRFNRHDNMRVRAENGQVTRANITANANQYVYVSFDVTVRDGRLDLEFSDQGGRDANWVLNRMSLIPK